MLVQVLEYLKVKGIENVFIFETQDFKPVLEFIRKVSHHLELDCFFIFVVHVLVYQQNLF